MRKSLVFACVAVLTLALGIGANTAIFSVIHAVLLNPLNYPDPERLVELGGSTPARFDQMKAATKTLTGVGAISFREDVTLITGTQPEVLKAARVSAGFLRILRAYPLEGRDFLPEEDSPSGPPVAIISAELWQRRFNGDTHIIGRTISLGTGPCTIIAVLPARFQFPFPGLDIWLTRPQDAPTMPAKSRAISPFLNLFGRVKPSATLQQAAAEVTVLQHQYAVSHPGLFDAKPQSFKGIKPLKEGMVSGIRSMLWMIFGAVGFVLLIACANIASLLLARASARSREFAVRAALGAGRGRLIAQLLAESVLLSVSGGILGLVIAVAAIHGIRSISSFDIPRAHEIHLDWTVLAFTIAISLSTGMLFGLLPSVSASRPDIIGALRAKGDTVGQANIQRNRLGLNARGMLVITQVALSIVLLIGAALLIQSVTRLRGENPGFNPANVLTFHVSLPPSRYDTDQKKRAFYNDLISRLESLPGARSAAVGMTLPMTTFAGTPVQDARKPVPKMNERLIARVNLVTNEFFQTLQIPIVRGRAFNDRDKEGSQRVAVINENLARHFWPAYPRGLDPIGQYMIVGAANPTPAQIIGIAADIHENVDNSAWPGSVYLSFEQAPLPTTMVALRTTRDPTRYAAIIPREVKALDRDQPVAEIISMENLIEAQLGERRLLLNLLGFFAAVALTLALVGIYGVIAYSVTQRTYELGIRRALGAPDRSILGLIISQAFALTIVGTAIGVAGAYALTRGLKNFLYGVTSTDPATFTAVSLLFICIALIASYIPARRATRLDPMAAFRYE